jgi:ketosteroid isomerase-like protein
MAIDVPSRNAATRAAGIVVLAMSLTPGCHAEEMTSAEDTDRPRAEAMHAVRQFLSAFERLDWPVFAAAFADDATVFFPPPAPPGRFTGRAAYESEFRNVFDTLRAARPAGPPFHRLDPEEPAIEMLAPDTALITFLLRNDQRIARRSLVLVHRGGRWLIQHLHASNAPVP